MRVSCLQENLAKGLALVSRAVASRNSLPVLNNILLEARDNQIRLAATNRQISISCWVGAKVVDEGEITIPARLFNDFINQLPPTRIDMELNVRTQSLHLSCGTADAQLKGIDAYDFPIIPTFQASQKEAPIPIQFDTRTLRKALDQVIFAASDDDNRPTLTGVELRFQQEMVTLTATDMHRLSLLHMPLDQPSRAEPVTVLIPADNLRELARISAETAETRPIQLLITPARNQVLFQLWGDAAAHKARFHRVELVSELIDARFPDPNTVIPQNATTQTVVETAALLQAARAAALFARGNGNRLAITLLPGNGFHSGQLRLTATSAEVGSNVHTINAAITGHALDIVLDVRFLIEILNRIEQSHLLLETTLPTRPCLIRPVGAETTFLHLIMPMHGAR
ncbi:MAG: DNA polymerase III subunit beta [Caldilineaceae bacterium]|nr:DNA polymerase III subunit beta [Caldilineaceae bacterium]